MREKGRFFFFLKENGNCQRLGGGGHCLMGTEFQFYKRKRVLEIDGGES